MKPILLFFIGSLVAVLPGCYTPSPVAKLQAEGKLLPVVRAIESFKNAHGRVPNSLTELQSKSPKILALEYSTESGRVWSISYEKKSASSYEVEFNHVHYNLYYSDGKETGWDFNPWR